MPNPTTVAALAAPRRRRRTQHGRGWPRPRATRAGGGARAGSRGGGFTGTPNVGFGLSDGGLRDWRLGWRLAPAVSGDTGFEVSLDATRREAANDDPEHGVMLRGAMRW